MDNIKAQNKIFVEEILKNAFHHDQSFQWIRGKKPDKEHYLFTQARVGTGKVIYGARKSSEEAFLTPTTAFFVVAVMTSNHELFFMENSVILFDDWTEVDWADLAAETQRKVFLFDNWYKEFCADYIETELKPLYDAAEVSKDKNEMAEIISREEQRKVILAKIRGVNVLTDFGYPCPKEETMMQYLCGITAPYAKEDRVIMDSLPRLARQHKNRNAFLENLKPEDCGLSDQDLELAHALFQIKERAKIMVTFSGKNLSVTCHMTPYSVLTGMVKGEGYIPVDCTPRNEGSCLDDFYTANGHTMATHKHITMIVHDGKIVFNQPAEAQE